MSKKYNFKIDEYSGSQFRGKFMVRDMIVLRTTYLCNDGEIREWALTQCGDGSITIYETREMAEQALEKYKNKGKETMEKIRKQDLRTGMVVKLKGYENIHTIDVEKEGIFYKETDGSISCAINLNMYDDDLNLLSQWAGYTIEYIYEQVAELIPKEDKFKDLKRAFAEGANIEYDSKMFGYWTDPLGKPEWFDEDKYRIKGGISIEAWDKHKEVIKEYWNGAEIEVYNKFFNTGWKRASSPVWTPRDSYRVRQEKVKELTIEQIEKMVGCKVKVVGDN